MTVIRNGIHFSLPTRTVTRRGSSHDPMSLFNFGWMPFACSLRSKRLLETFTMAPDTSDQYTSTSNPRTLAPALLCITSQTRPVHPVLISPWRTQIDLPLSSFTASHVEPREIRATFRSLSKSVPSGVPHGSFSVSTEHRLNKSTIQCSHELHGHSPGQYKHCQQQDWIIHLSCVDFGDSYGKQVRSCDTVFIHYFEGSCDILPGSRKVFLLLNVLAIRSFFQIVRVSSFRVRTSILECSEPSHAAHSRLRFQQSFDPL